ncbi:hypothetical protein PYV00_07045 [Novosphingobium sp. H3SJ31-1]|uniref:Penicillin-binding protein transpeptidase domain-containing protein n=1 Tax=Novosphingobium album (ex Liu et al. 2023) TaxID=3031130 RepID=A0ABT5WN63_9SPHN|nr:hypothetical protein [Novosphingobium album (ex Liu et al. 2023)]MDE8651474.1 hypothetical protein [Novosphingobium album (ex Liu et al. 2023)]
MLALVQRIDLIFDEGQKCAFNPGRGTYPVLVAHYREAAELLEACEIVQAVPCVAQPCVQRHALEIANLGEDVNPLRPFERGIEPAHHLFDITLREPARNRGGKDIACVYPRREHRQALLSIESPVGPGSTRSQNSLAESVRRSPWTFAEPSGTFKPFGAAAPGEIGPGGLSSEGTLAMDLGYILSAFDRNPVAGGPTILHQ